MVAFTALAEACARFKLTEPIAPADMAYIAHAMKTAFPGEPVEVFRHVDPTSVARLAKHGITREPEPVTVRVGNATIELHVA